jgi:hypothetical protein
VSAPYQGSGRAARPCPSRAEPGPRRGGRGGAGTCRTGRGGTRTCTCGFSTRRTPARRRRARGIPPSTSSSPAWRLSSPTPRPSYRSCPCSLLPAHAALSPSFLAGARAGARTRPAPPRGARAGAGSEERVPLLPQFFPLPFTILFAAAAAAAAATCVASPQPSAAQQRGRVAMSG